MKRHFYILITGALLLIVQACNNTKDVETELHKADVYMDEHPELALKALEAIDADELTTRKTQAKHALLYSMALDKNYIDLTTDSIINLAVDYYKYHKDQDSRFKAYYYQARIYENAGDYEQAMESIAHAENINGNIDPAYKGRLLLLKESIYATLMEYDKAVSAAEGAAQYSLEGDQVGNYHQAILNIARYKMIEHKAYECEQYLDIILKHWDELSIKRKHTFYDIKMLLHINTNPDSSLVYLNEYLNLEDQESAFNWRTISHVYERNSLYPQALDAINKYGADFGTSDDAAYHIIKSHIYEGLMDYKSAFESYKQYIAVSDSSDLKLLGQDTKYVEERFQKQLTIIRQKTIITLCIILSLFVLVIFTILYRRKKQQTDHLISLLEDLREEHNELIELQRVSNEAYKQMKINFEEMEIEHDKLLEIHNENKLSFENAQKILDKRIQSLGAFLSKDLPDSISKVAEEIEDLTKNRYVIVDNIGMLYAIYHPEFVGKLTEKGLTASEIGYCCLLLLGMKTSEVGSVICRSGTYNMSSGIRNKLQLTEKDTRLSIWLRNLFEESKAS
ncbi:MAG: hypothetical protein IJX11_01135 [Bacteroidales bacterium]|nr:hypothetical protein [Bacteroidales bacterium]